MGKIYHHELDIFPATYQWAMEQDISILDNFITDSSDLPLYGIGSGGSFTSASFLTMLHNQCTFISKPITPFEYLSMDEIPFNHSLILISASGRNSDIITAFRKAAFQEPKNLMVICGSSGSPLVRICKRFNYSKIFQFQMASGRDGFLATNSLLATCIFLLRAYNEVYSLPWEIPRSFQNLVSYEMTVNIEEILKPLSDKNTIIILYDRWSQLAAIDAESKLTEAGLVNVQTSDYRNFAHGRHNWIAKNMHNTGIIGLTTHESRELASRTFSLIPQETPVVRFDTSHSGPIASLSLLFNIMRLVEFFGSRRKIDPGRPGVPSFGRNIYNLRVPSYRSWTTPKLTTNHFHIRRKILASYDGSHYDMSFWKHAYAKFMRSLTKASFDIVIFDYDGTLCSPENRFTGISSEIQKHLVKLLKGGIKLGIISGRGKSIRTDLINLIPSELHRQVTMGYYNGSDIGSLGDDSHPNLDMEYHQEINRMSILLNRSDLLKGLAKFETRPNQITVEINKFKKKVNSILWDLLNTRGFTGKLQILESSHSIDILPIAISKLNLYDYFESQHKDGKKSLCIGDKGLWPGNDYALLSTPHSLSVDEVSRDPDTCWNLTRPGHKGPQGLEDYLEAIDIKSGTLKIHSNNSDKL